jgi:hypothetical protein
MQWTAADIQPGTPISKRRSDVNPHFKVPAIIVKLPTNDKEKDKGWGLCELSDGYLIGLSEGKFGTKEELAKELTELGYFPVPKMIFNGGLGTLPENRQNTPVLAMTYSDY